ncbi:MAG: hypothetical protein AAGA17_03835 [Actinomycetota bacterium]
MVVDRASVRVSMEEKHARAAALRADGSLRQLAAEVAPVTLAAEQILPLPTPLDDLVPEGGLRRGWVVAVDGVAATSLTLALAAETTTSGSWVAFVGVPEVGLLAAAELGVDLARCLVVRLDDARHWSEATAALLGAVDLIVTRPPSGVRQREVRRLAARARERGTVLIRLPGGDEVMAVDRRLRTTSPTWVGLSPGRGRLVARRLRVDRGDRSGGGATRSVEVWLPGPTGRLAPVEEVAVPESSRRPALRTVS